MTNASEQYALRYAVYESFARRLSDLLRTLLDQARVRIHTIEWRAKEIDSFRKKVARPEKQYTDPLNQITDLAGVRVIVYYIGDVEVVNGIIAAEFDVDREHSSDQASLLKPNEFGYRSIHQVIRLAEARAALTEWRAYRGLRAEVQVRTVLQHAWAAISHALSYKGSADVPSELARKLFRVSGLLELADEEFAAISTRSVQLASDAATAIEAGELSRPVDRPAVVSYLEVSETVLAITKAAYRAGFRQPDGTDEDADPDRERDAIGELTWACTVAGLRSVGELDSTCRAHLPLARDYFQSLIRRADTEWSGMPPWFVQLVVMLAHVDVFSAPQLVERGWDKDIAARVTQTARQINTTA